MKILFILIFGFLIPINIQAQENEKKTDALENAESFLDFALKNKSERKVMEIQMIPTKENAINFAENILFELYGKEKIESEKPYKIHQVNDYWLISGTLPEGWVGGVFDIVFDSWNGRILLVQHGK